MLVGEEATFFTWLWTATILWTPLRILDSCFIDPTKLEDLAPDRSSWRTTNLNDSNGREIFEEKRCQRGSQTHRYACFLSENVSLTNWPAILSGSPLKKRKKTMSPSAMTESLKQQLSNNQSIASRTSIVESEILPETSVFLLLFETLRSTALSSKAWQLAYSECGKSRQLSITNFLLDDERSGERAKLLDVVLYRASKESDAEK